MGFTSMPDEEDSEESSESGGDEEPQTSFSMTQTASDLSMGDGLGRLDTMSLELDALVKFVRRGAESLAGGTSDAAATFGVIAFALEDWDA